MARPHTPPLAVLGAVIIAVVVSNQGSAATAAGTTLPGADGGCFYDNATGPIMYIGGNLFGSKYATNTTPDAAGCCALCTRYASVGCVLWTHGAAPTCYGKPGPCCWLKTTAGWAGRKPAQPGTVSGSTKPFPPPPPPPSTCRDGTNCGGTNLWMRWPVTTLPNASSLNPGTMPYPRSKDLVGWEFKSGCNPGYGGGKANGFKGASADTFYPTWAADGNLYTGFTDGNVHDDIAGTTVHASSEGRAPLFQVTHGQAAIVGDDPFNLTITKVKPYSPVGYSAYPYGGRFPSGSLVYNGTWWYGTYFVPNYPQGPLVGGLLGPLVDFRHSTDGGDTWVEPRLNATGPADNLFGEVGDPLGKPGGPSRIKFGTPHFVDFGQELEHSPDGKAYIVAHGATSPSSTEMWMLGDQVYMARVTPTVAAMNDKSQWEFYAGGHGASAKWVAGDVSQAAPLIEFTNHTGSTTMTYLPALKKYVVTICTAHNYPVMDGGHFDTWMLESDDVTGPWALVEYLQSFGPQVYFANFVSKFTAQQINATDRTLESMLMYSANYDSGGGTPNPPNSAYHMNLQQSRFDLSESFTAELQARLAAEQRGGAP